MSKHGATANLGQLAGIFGVSRPTVTQWTKRGCPFVTKADRKTGREWAFDTAAVIQWHRDSDSRDVDGVSSVELERRKLAAETTLAELKAATARGELGSIEEFERQLTGRVIEARKKLLQIPKRLEPTDRERRAVLTDEILRALTAITDDIGDD